MRILIVTTEDDPNMALKPRLRAAGADMNNVCWSHGDYGIGADDALTAIENMRQAAPYIEAAILENNIHVVAVDPIGPWVEEDGNSSARVRAAIDPLNGVARRTRAAIILVAHLRKAPSEDPMDSFAGSHAMTAAVRVAISIAALNAEESTLQVVKSNFHRPKLPLVFRLEGGTEVEPPRVVWRGGDSYDLAAIVQRQRQQAPVVSPQVVKAAMVGEHRRLDDEAKRIHKMLLPNLRGITVSGVRDTLVQLVTEGKAYEGQGQRGARTIGLNPSAPVDTLTTRATAAWVADPKADVRTIATRVGCSVGLAQKASKLVHLFTGSCSQPHSEQVNTKTEPVNNADCSVHSLPLSPIGGQGGSEREQASGARGDECSLGHRRVGPPRADEDQFPDAEPVHQGEWTL